MGKPLPTYTTPEKSTKYECNYDALVLGNKVKIAERSVVEGGKWTWTEEGWEGIPLNNPFLRDFWTLYKKPSPITSSNSFLGAHLVTLCCLHDVERKNQVIEMLHFDWSSHEPTPITTYLLIIYSSISSLYIYIISKSFKLFLRPLKFEFVLRESGIAFHNFAARQLHNFRPYEVVLGLGKINILLPLRL